MSVLKIRDSNGNVKEILVIKGEDGKDYVLTEEDKQEIAGMVSGGGSGGADVDLSNYYTKEETDTAISDAVNSIEVPDADMSNYYTKEETDDVIDGKLDVLRILAAYGTPSEGLNIEGNTVIGIGTCTDEHIVIPEFSSDGTKITTVADDAFGYGLNGNGGFIKSITFPPSIEMLGRSVILTHETPNLEAIYITNPFIEWIKEGEGYPIWVGTPNVNIFYSGTREDWVDINTSGNCTMVTVQNGNFPTVYYELRITDIELSQHLNSMGYQTKEQVLALIQANMPVSGDGESY